MLVNLDATDIKVDKTTDAFGQMQTFSGDRGKGHCLMFSNLTCPAGSVLAVSPGPSISCPPRGGEAVSIGVQLQMSEAREQQTNTTQGFTKLLKGTGNLGTAIDVDRGYVYEPRNVNTRGNPSFVEYCDQNDILLLTRVRTGESAFEFNSSSGLLEQVQNNTDPTRAANTGRIATFIRAGSENMHTIKETWQNLNGRANHTRILAIGPHKINYYNNKYGKQFGEEWYEQPFLNAEYLVCVGLWNRFRTKFYRYAL